MLGDLCREVEENEGRIRIWWLFYGLIESARDRRVLAVSMYIATRICKN